MASPPLVRETWYQDPEQSVPEGHMDMPGSWAVEQAAHWVKSAPDWKVPAGQGRQTLLPSAEKVPAPHTLAEQLVLASPTASM